MSYIGLVVSTLCAFFPVWVVAIALGMLALLLIIIIVKLIAFVLDAIPFM